MALEDLSGVKFVARRYTEDADPHRGSQLAAQVLGAGSFIFGAEVEGAFIPLVELKAGGVLKKIEAAKQEKKSGSKSSGSKE